MPLGESIKSVVARINSIGVTDPQPTQKPLGELLGMEVSAEDVALDKVFVASREAQKRQAVNLDNLSLYSPAGCTPLKQAQKGEVFYSNKFAVEQNPQSWQIKCDPSTGAVNLVTVQPSGYLAGPALTYAKCDVYIEGGDIGTTPYNTFQSICKTTNAFQNPAPTAPVVTSDPGAIAGGVIGGLAGGAIIGGLIGYAAYLARKYYKTHKPSSDFQASSVNSWSSAK